jgi:hypothetical protein
MAPPAPTDGAAVPEKWVAPSRRERTALWGLGVAILALYVANGARYQGADTLGAPYTALSLLRDGDFYIDDLVRNQRGYWFERGRQGVVSIYGFGPPLVAMPAYEVFHALWRGRWTENRLLIAGKVTAALMTAVAAVLLGIAARRFASFGTSLVVVLVFAVCSPAWSTSSQALWKDTPAVFLLATGLAMILWPSGRAPPSALLPLAAVPLGLSVWCRENLVLIVAAAAIYILRTRGKVSALSFSLVAALVIAGLVALNIAHFGTPLHSGALAHGTAVALQQGAHPWDTPIWVGLYGLLLSPSRGLLVYSPIFLASVVGVWLAIRGAERPAWVFLAASALLAFAPSIKWHFWWGGAGFGPRLMATTTPFLALLIIPTWRHLGGASHLLRIAFAVLAIFSVTVQAAGAFRYDGRAWDEPNATQSIDSHPERLFRWSDSQLLFYLRWPSTSPDRIPWR